MEKGLQAENQNDDGYLSVLSLRVGNWNGSTLASVTPDVNKRLVLVAAFWLVGAAASVTTEGMLIGIPLVTVAAYLLLVYGN